MDTLEILKHNELFSGLEEEELSIIANLTKKRTVPKNTMVISEGDTASSLFIIKTGRVNVTLSNEQGKEIILSALRQGDHFGELSLLDDEPRSANVITVEKCEFLVLTKQEFYPLLIQNASIAISIIKYLCHRVRLITNIAEGLALTDVYGRLVKLLMDLAVPQESGGKLVIELPLTHKEISMRVGSSREMVSRIMSELEKGNYLTTENKKITINKKLPLAW
ncbi:MAG: Crp/Fnr family transcriptional regulator [Gammaproteobacteria bacterium]